VRLLRHGWVLLIALLLPVIAPRLPIAASLTSAAPTTAVLNAVIEGTPPQGGVVSGPALTVMAPAGATVASLATTYDRNLAAIAWANGLDPNAEAPAGSPLLLPPGPGALVKVLGDGSLTRPLRVEAHAFSKSAESAITAAGGSTTLVPLPFGNGRPPAKGNALTNR